MDVCLVAAHGKIFQPVSGLAELKYRSCSTSNTGKYLAAVSDSVEDLVDAAGEASPESLCSISQVAWSPDDDRVFISTSSSLLGVLTIDVNSEYFPSRSSRFSEDEETGQAITDADIAPYVLTLDSVLVLPFSDYTVCGSSQSLFVLSKKSRLLLLVDWKNYRSKARRFMLPPEHDDGGCSSPINSVLPVDDSLEQMSYEAILSEESLMCCVEAVVSIRADALVVLYENGMIRLFSVSKATHPMSTILACPRSKAIALFDDLLAVVTLNNVVYCYQLVTSDEGPDTRVTSGNSRYRLCWRWIGVSQHKDNSIVHTCWSDNFLLVVHGRGVSVVNRFGQTVITHEGSFSTGTLSVKYKSIATVHQETPEQVEFLSLALSGRMFSKCTDEYQSRLFVTRNSLRLFDMSEAESSNRRTAFKHIPLPTPLVQDHGQIGNCWVQLNPLSTHVIAVPISGMGFALWSSYNSSLARKTKQEGKWEYLPDRSQEETVGRVDIAGFLSDTVFCTLSETSKELLLWSVHRRVDLTHSLGAYKIDHRDERASVNVSVACVAASLGMLAVMYAGGSVHVLKLSAGPSKTYRLEQIHSACILQSTADMLSTLYLFPSCVLCATTQEGEWYWINCDSLAETSGNSAIQRISGKVKKLFCIKQFGLPRDHLAFRIEEKNEHPITDDAGLSESDTETPLEQQSVQSPPPLHVPSESHIDTCILCQKMSTNWEIHERVSLPTPEVVRVVHSGGPFIFAEELDGNLSVWTIDVVGNTTLSSENESSCESIFPIQYVGRVSQVSSGFSVSNASYVLGISSMSGVGYGLSGDSDGLRIVSTFSVLHPILLVAHATDAYNICRSISAGSACHMHDFALVLETWLYSAIEASLSILKHVHKGVMSSCQDPPIERDSRFHSQLLVQHSQFLCLKHPLTEYILHEVFLKSFWVASHFPSVFQSVFASAVRKTEAHVLLPFAVGGCLAGISCESMFWHGIGGTLPDDDKLSNRSLEGASLLLLILQERYGPQGVRKQFAIPLFKQCLERNNYSLAKNVFMFISLNGAVKVWSMGMHDETEDIVVGYLRSVVASHSGNSHNILALQQLTRIAIGLQLDLSSEGGWITRSPELLGCVALIESVHASGAPAVI